MPLDELRIEEQTNGYQYDIHYIQGVDPTQTKDAVSIAPPGQSAKNNILLGLQGQEADISIRFRAVDDGRDKSNGTVPAGAPYGTVETLDQQRRYLETYIHNPSFDARWQLTHLNGNHYDGDEIYVERIRTPVMQVDNRKMPEWTIDLRRGASV